MQSFWAKARMEAPSVAKMDNAAAATAASAVPESGTSPDLVEAEPSSEAGGRPKSRSFNGGIAATAAVPPASTSFLSKLTPLIPAQLMRPTAKPSSGPATAADEPVSAPVPSTSLPPPRAGRRRPPRRQKSAPVLHMADEDVQVPLGGAVPTGDSSEARAGGVGANDSDEDADDDDDDDDDDDEERSDTSWDGLDDVYASPQTPSAVGHLRRRSNSDAGSVHSAFSVTNLVGKCVAPAGGGARAAHRGAAPRRQRRRCGAGSGPSCRARARSSSRRTWTGSVRPRRRQPRARARR